MIIDKPLAELEQYKPSLTRQHDFDAFWEQTLNESADQPLNATLEKVPYPVERVTVYRVSYVRVVAAARASIGEEAFAAAWAEGRAIPLAQALTATPPQEFVTHIPATGRNVQSPVSEA